MNSDPDYIYNFRAQCKAKALVCGVSTSKSVTTRKLHIGDTGKADKGVRVKVSYDNDKDKDDVSSLHDNSS